MTVFFPWLETVPAAPLLKLNDKEASQDDISDADSESEGGVKDEDEDKVVKALQCDHDMQLACRDCQLTLEDKVSDVGLATRIHVYSPVSFISLY